MPRFSRDELASFRDTEVPGLWTAATQTHFAHPVNRFYPALFRAGITEHPIDPGAGMTDSLAVAYGDAARAAGVI